MQTYNHVTNTKRQTSNHAHTGMKVRMGQNGAVDYPVTSWSAQLFKETGLLRTTTVCGFAVFARMTEDIDCQSKNKLIDALYYCEAGWCSIGTSYHSSNDKAHS